MARQLVRSGLVLLAVAGLALPTQGFGRRKQDCHDGGYVAAPSYTGATGGGCGAVAYEERTITAYRPEVVEREVERTVNRLSTREVAENYNYTEFTWVPTTQKV